MPRCDRPADNRARVSVEELPPPSAEARGHSERLLARIRQAIAAAGGALAFDRYMELVLYESGLGYYSGGSRKFGAAGDFVTAPEMGGLFAGSLARFIAAADVAPRLLEFGAGSGALAADLLAAAEALGRLPERYLIVELSGELRARQRETLAARVPHLLERVAWADALPERWDGVVIANEVADAMPVQRFRLADAGIEQWVVTWGPGLESQWREADDRRLVERAVALGERFDLPLGYVSEVNLRAEDWVRSLADRLDHGLILVVDYGFPAHEFYHPQRAGGTLMCHYRHRAHSDPFLYPGLQDITAHVDFTALAEAAFGAGLQVLGFSNQANFLLANGLAEQVAAAEGRRRFELAAEVKRLTMPGEMGELFKVLLLGRGFPAGVPGFSLRDERARL